METARENVEWQSGARWGGVMMEYCATRLCHPTIASHASWWHHDTRRRYDCLIPRQNPLHKALALPQSISRRADYVGLCSPVATQYIHSRNPQAQVQRKPSSQTISIRLWHRFRCLFLWSLGVWRQLVSWSCGGGPAAGAGGGRSGCFLAWQFRGMQTGRRRQWW